MTQKSELQRLCLVAIVINIQSVLATVQNVIHVMF